MPKKISKLPVEIEAEKYYTIVGAHGGRALTADANNVICMRALDRTENQQWRFVDAGGCYKIMNRQTGEVVDVILAGTDNGAQIHQWEDVDAENQLWVLEPATKTACKIKSKPSGKCLDVVGISAEDGARVQIWDDLDGANQLWMLADASMEAQPAPAKKPAAPRAAKKPTAKKPAAPKAEEKTAAQAQPAGTGEKPAAQAAAPKAGKKPAAKKPAAPKAEKKAAAKPVAKPAVEPAAPQAAEKPAPKKPAK